MRKFVLKITAFLLLATSAFLLLSWSLNQFARSKADFQLSKKATKAVFGHSHTECAFNDQFIPGMVNFSGSGEAYFYTLTKVQKVIEANPSIKTVFIEFTNNQVRARMDTAIWEDNYLAFGYAGLFPFFETDQHTLILKHNPTGMVNFSGLAVQKNLARLAKSDWNYDEILGSFKAQNKVLSDSLIEAERMQPPRKIQSLCSTNLSYLRRLIDYCHRQQVKVFLVRSPQHEAYSLWVNEAKFQKVRSDLFSDVEFLDFGRFPLPDAFFADTEHLNDHGAQLFSSYLSKLFDNGLLEASDKQQMIEAEMNAVR